MGTLGDEKLNLVEIFQILLGIMDILKYTKKTGYFSRIIPNFSRRTGCKTLYYLVSSQNLENFRFKNLIFRS